MEKFTYKIVNSYKIVIKIRFWNKFHKKFYFILIKNVMAKNCNKKITFFGINLLVFCINFSKIYIFVRIKNVNGKKFRNKCKKTRRNFCVDKPRNVAEQVLLEPALQLLQLLLLLGGGGGRVQLLLIAAFTVHRRRRRRHCWGVARDSRSEGSGTTLKKRVSF